MPHAAVGTVVKVAVSRLHEYAPITGAIPFMFKLATAKFLPQFKLGTKAVLCAVLLIAVNTALVVGAGYWSLTTAINDRALRDIEVNLRTLALAFAEIVPDAKIMMRDGAVVRAEIPKMPDFKD